MSHASPPLPERLAFVRLTWGLATADADAFAARFHERLFASDPSLLLLATEEELAERGRAFVHAVSVAVRHFDRFPAAPRTEVRAAARGAVVAALVAALRDTLRDTLHDRLPHEALPASAAAAWAEVLAPAIAALRRRQLHAAAAA